MKILRFIYCVALMVTIPGSIFALDLGEKVRINGFLSQGYLKSSDNNFLSSESQDGTFELNEFGLTLTSQPTDNLRLGIQLLSRDAGDDGNNTLTVDWAFGDYLLRDWLGVRFGKVKTPLGLYNTTRDQDLLRTMVFLPQSIYDEGLRDIVSTVYGGGLYGNIAFEAFGDLDYQIVYGMSSVPDDSLMMKKTKEKATLYSTTPVPYGFGGNPVDEISFHDKGTLAASLVYNTPLYGLRFGISYFDSESVFNTKDANGVLITDFTSKQNDMWVVSLEYGNEYMTLVGEYMEITTSLDGFAEDVYLSPFWTGHISEATSQGWYVQGSAPVPGIPALSVSVMYDVFYPDKEIKSGDDHSKWRKDLGLGLRYDINGNWLLKAEYHDIDGTSMTSSVNPGPREKDWSYFVFKTSFYF